MWSQDSRSTAKDAPMAGAVGHTTSPDDDDEGRGAAAR
jgi:hypothetical protein